MSSLFLHQQAGRVICGLNEEWHGPKIETNDGGGRGGGSINTGRGKPSTAHAHAHAHTHTRTRARAHAHAHTHTHTHTRTQHTRMRAPHTHAHNTHACARHTRIRACARAQLHRHTRIPTAEPRSAAVDDSAAARGLSHRPEAKLLLPRALAARAVVGAAAAPLSPAPPRPSRSRDAPSLRGTKCRRCRRDRFIGAAVTGSAQGVHHRHQHQHQRAVPPRSRFTRAAKPMLGSAATGIYVRTAHTRIRQGQARIRRCAGVVPGGGRGV
jgi:hypothetical protein